MIESEGYQITGWAVLLKGVQLKVKTYFLEWKRIYR